MMRVERACWTITVRPVTIQVIGVAPCGHHTPLPPLHRHLWIARHITGRHFHGFAVTADDAIAEASTLVDLDDQAEA